LGHVKLLHWEVFAVAKTGTETCSIAALKQKVLRSRTTFCHCNRTSGSVTAAGSVPYTAAEACIWSSSNLAASVAKQDTMQKSVAVACIRVSVW